MKSIAASVLFSALLVTGCGDSSQPPVDTPNEPKPTSADLEAPTGDDTVVRDDVPAAEEHPAVEVNDDTFAAIVLDSEQPVLVDFWAPWCGPCRTQAPVIEQIAAEYNGRVTIAKLNVDEAPGTAKKYGITGIPTLLFVQNGQVVETMVGVQSDSTLTKKLDAMLAE